MKRNNHSFKVMRRRSTENASGENSRYARKVRGGKQDYGPGCCGHGQSSRYNEKLVELLRRSNPNKSRKFACA